MNKLRIFIKTSLVLLVIYSYLGFSNSYTQPSGYETQSTPPPFLIDSNHWVDSVFESLTLDERIAQDFMVAAYPNKNKAHVDQVTRLSTDYKV